MRSFSKLLGLLTASSKARDGARSLFGFGLLYSALVCSNVAQPKRHMCTDADKRGNLRGARRPPDTIQDSVLT